MLGAFLFPLGHLLFDDSRIDSIAARFDFLLLQLPKQSLVPRLKRLGCPRVTFRQSTFEDLETTGKGKTIGIQADRCRCLEHQGANHKVRKR